MISRALTILGSLLLATSFGCGHNTRIAAPERVAPPTVGPMIILDGVALIVESAVTDSLSLHLRHFRGSTVLSLERVVGFDRNRRPVMTVLDTIQVTTGSASVFRHCSETNKNTWVPLGRGSRILTDQPSWNIVDDTRLERSGLSGKYGCPEVEDGFDN